MGSFENEGPALAAKNALSPLTFHFQKTISSFCVKITRSIKKIAIFLRECWFWMLNLKL